MEIVGNKRPGSAYALMVLLAIQALGAIAGGIGLIQDPVDNIGMSLDFLEGSPFDDYLVPGLILLILVVYRPCWRSLASPDGADGAGGWRWPPAPGSSSG